MSLKKKASEKMAEEIFYGEYKCPYCKRIVPNFSFLTKKACIWCDNKYWDKKIKKEEKA